MAVEKIEKQVMGLDINSRAKLVSKLLRSLEDLSESEIEKLWIEEAARRDDEIAKGRAKTIAADVAFKRARARLKND